MDRFRWEANQWNTVLNHVLELKVKPFEDAAIHHSRYPNKVWRKIAADEEVPDEFLIAYMI